jgi:hypothetical protein
MGVGAVFKPFSVRVAFAAAFLYCAAAVNLNPEIQHFHQADTLLRGLISTVRWTPFYWQENRLGSLAPLLALGFHDPEWSVIFQCQFHVLACLAVLLLVVCLCAPAGKALSAESLLCAQIMAVLAAIVIPLNGQSVPSYFLGEPYALSLSLLLSALLIAIRPPAWPASLRYCAIFLLSFLAFWTYIPHVVLALVVFGLFPGVTLRDRLRTGAWIAAAAMVVVAWQKLTPGPDFGRLINPAGIPAALAALASNASTVLVYPARLALAAAAGLVLLTLRKRSFNRAPFVLLAGAASLAGLTVISAWARDNEYNPRFIASPAILLVALGCYPIALELARLTGKLAPRFCIAASVVLVAGATIALGIPSPSGARSGLEQVTAVGAEQISELGCTHMIGSYWKVWPSVIYRLAHSNGSDLWGVTLRAQVIEDLWDTRDPASRLYCSVCGDDRLEPIRSMFRIPRLVEDTRARGICRYKILLPDLK